MVGLKCVRLVAPELLTVATSETWERPLERRLRKTLFETAGKMAPSKVSGRLG
jgi:hypothetical protein